MSLFSKVKDYARGVSIITDWLGSGGVPVSRGLAEQRSDTCLICPHNKACVPIVADISEFVREQVELKNHLNLKVDGEESLFTCEQCSCPLKLKVWVPLKLIKPTEEEKDKFPLACWLRTESL